MKLEKRSSFGWGASAAGYGPCKNGLVAHYDGSNQGLAGKSHSACRSYWKSTRQFHMGSSRGWADIGYSFAVCPHGYVLEGRGWQRQQAAQPGGNSTWTSCTFMSGPSETPTSAQINAFRELRAWLRSKGLAAAVRGHRDFISTSCPGSILYGMVKNGTLTGAPSKHIEEDDMPSAGDLWGHPIGVPDYAKDLHAAESYPAGGWLRGTEVQARRARIAAEANGAAIGELSKALAALAADRGQTVDVDALVGRIEDAIERITVRLDVPDEEPVQG